MEVYVKLRHSINNDNKPINYRFKIIRFHQSHVNKATLVTNAKDHTVTS